MKIHTLKHKFVVFILLFSSLTSVLHRSGYGLSNNHSTSDNPLNSENFEKDIAAFMGVIRTSPEDAQLAYLHPQIEEKFFFLFEEFGTAAIQQFFLGVTPVIEYQSQSSALVLFYNPWNDLVFITEWQVFGNNLLITDIEFISADFLDFDGSPVKMNDPLWLRLKELTPIDNIYAQTNARIALFDELWKDQFGVDKWREALFSLSDVDLLLWDQSVVALRLRNQLVNLINLEESKKLEVLRKPVHFYLEQLKSGENGMMNVLVDAYETTEASMNMMLNTHTDLWKNITVQAMLKVSNGAFVFASSPNLPKYFLSLYFEFSKIDEIQIKRLDWCSLEIVNRDLNPADN